MARYERLTDVEHGGQGARMSYRPSCSANSMMLLTGV
jgi:hypothetical protein